MRINKMMGGAFDVISRCRALDKVNVTKYKSSRTGMQLTIADVESPLVKGYFCLGTEDCSDDGLPHTLEHLVFMGSRRYPFKGVLDVVANRCLASGTNAWTDQDHTCYTLDTAGSQGFLKLLPIYIEHILDPTLSEAQYLTEVHHINGEGMDAGVVYSEMQEYESSMSEIVGRAVKEALYPPGCGYRSETGGRLTNLRESCSHAKVTSFHDKFYCPQNLNVIIVGTVEHERVMDVITPVEDYILQTKGEVCIRPFIRPFHKNIDPLVSSTCVQLPCPVDDATAGMVVFAWRGPYATNIYETTAFHILNEYLTDSAVSPLERDFVQIPQPLCSHVSPLMEENWECKIGFSFKGVPIEKLNCIRPLLETCLGNVICGKEEIDSERMKDILRQSINRSFSQLESNPHSALADPIIGDFLYGINEKDFETRLNHVSIYKSLIHQPPSFWSGLLQKYFAKDKPVVVAIGVPNASLGKELAEEEKRRVNEQKDKLGAEGLGDCEKQLQAAIDENEVFPSFGGEPDEDLLNRCIVNSLEGVHPVSVTASTNRSTDEDVNEFVQLAGIPFTTLLSHCNTNFVQFSMLIDTRNIDVKLRKYLLVWNELMFESGIVRDGKLVPYQQTVKELNRDLLKHSSGIAFKRMANVEVKVALDDFSLGINWLKDLMFGVNVDRDRLLVVVNKLLNAIPALKRDGHSVASFLHKYLCYQKDSNPVVQSLLYQAQFLKEFKSALENDPSQHMENLNKLKGCLTSKNGNLVLHVTCDAKLIPKDAVNGLHALGVNGAPSKAEIGVNEPKFLLNKCEFGQGAIIPISACESSYFMQSTRSIQSYSCADLPSIQLCLQYLCQCEGPIWRQIRGQGLAYNASLDVSPDNGLITLDLYRSSQLLQAYQQMKSIIENHVDGNEEINADEWEGARRSLVFEIIEKAKDVHSASEQGLRAYFRDVPQEYNRNLCDEIWKLDCKSAWLNAGPYLKSVFDWSQSNTAITCHPSKTDEIVQGFSMIGRHLKVMSAEDPQLTALN